MGKKRRADDAWSEDDWDDNPVAMPPWESDAAPASPDLRRRRRRRDRDADPALVPKDRGRRHR